MADSKISALSPATTLDGTEVIPGVQSGSNVKMTTQAVADLAFTGSDIASLTAASALDGTELSYAVQGGNDRKVTTEQERVWVSRVPQNSKSAAYTTVLSDAGKHIFHPSADTTARIWTIDSNANVAYPIGTAITFVNQNSGGVITIAITSDTMRLAGPGTTGSRTLAANGMATAIKVTSTEWIISGTGLT